MEPLPSLRNIDAFPLQHEGQTLICVSDPAGYVEERILLSIPAFFIASCLDGTNSVESVQRACAAQFGGQWLSQEQILQVVSFLDEHGFLDSPRYESKRQAVLTAFQERPSRPAYLAGKSYPEDPEELRRFFGECFTQAGYKAPHAEPAYNSLSSGTPLVGLIVPHIDYPRGALGYAHGYQALWQSGVPDTVIIFGVAHAGAEAPYVLTRKDFETPFGTLTTAQYLVERLAAACAWDPFQEEIVHRTEHSVEFQTTMLAYLYGTRPKIVPILAGSVYACVEDIRSLRADLEPFFAACRACIEEERAQGRSVTVIAGADLAHVGYRFGDPFDIDDTVVDAVRTRDEEDLAHAYNRDAHSFYASVMRDMNARRVCGYGCILGMLAALGKEGPGGRMLHYGYAPDPAGGIVSFAAVAYL